MYSPSALDAEAKAIVGDDKAIYIGSKKGNDEGCIIEFDFSKKDMVEAKTLGGYSLSPKGCLYGLSASMDGTYSKVGPY